ncbi:MAG: hypothetical protein IPP94_12670 [Ignavibacteria bacterium]|nr:hypothetical protein [Ignavibacteria bacterium]
MKVILSFLMLLPAATGFGQYFEPRPRVDDPSLPAWMRLLVCDRPNLRVVDSAFAAHYATRVFEKNAHTQYYKRFRRWAQRHATADGSIRVPSPGDELATEQRLRAERGALAKRGTGAGVWTFLGHRTTHATGGDTTKVTWQTNIYCLDQSFTDPDILFCGGETGGIFRSSDRGLHWEQVSGGFLHGSVRPVKIDPSNPAVVYAGTGGKLVKTTDGGATWAAVYAEADLWTHDMLVSAVDPRVVCAATNKGFLRSIDGGATWTKVFANECWTVAARPGDARVVYTVRDSANASQFCRSSDGGATFQSGAPGWWQPAARQEVYGVRITVTAAAPGRIYALIGASASAPDNLHNYAGVFGSTDDGRTWANTNPSGLVGEPYTVPTHTNLSAADGIAGLSQGFYDFAIIANPMNAGELVAGGTSWWRSSDAGATWNPLGGYVGGLPWAHPDMQWLCANGRELWICSDGGINSSVDFAKTHEPRMDGIGGSDFWGFDGGWNEDVFVGGRYHNGNTAFVEGYPDGRFLRMGGGEAATGYLHPDDNRRAYFSDIGGYVLPTNPIADPIPFSVGMWPNESYYHAEFSGMTFDPRCSGTVYIGNGNSLWKSTDAGASYARVHRFRLGTDTNATVEHVRIARANPSVMYVSLRSNAVWDGAIWRTTDGGGSWTECAPIPALSWGARRVVTMDVSGSDAQELWVGLRSGFAADEKVFTSTDGGAHWINLSTPVIAQAPISYIAHQLGTDGGVYVGTTMGGMYYRNHAMSDWAPYGGGLPLSISTRILKPFYRDGKIRCGSDMGIWEAPFYEPSRPVAQISVDRMRTDCPRDTFYFSDRSVLRQDAATTWSWSFPGAAWVSSTTARNPKVLYSAPGVYTVSLTVNQAGLPSSQTLPGLITVEAGGCEPDTVPGFAVSLGGNADPGLVEVPPLGIRTNRFTFSAWVKPDGVQPSFASILCGNGAEINVDGDNELHYYWPPNGQWWIGSGLRVPPGEWTHVALVATPDSITLYVNGRGWSSHHTNDSVSFTAGMLIGNYNHWGDRYFKGRMDEACFFDRALSRDEIRERMHLTRRNAGAPSPSDSGLVAYYQFNETDGRANDRIATRHAALVGSASRVPSRGPFGGGTSFRADVRTPGSVDFPGTGVRAAFPPAGILPDGDVVFSRISSAPDTRPAAAPGSRGYWIGDNYGNNASFTLLDSIRFAGYGPIAPVEAGDPRIYSMYTRPSNADGPTWGSALDRADAALAGQDGSVAFSTGNGVTRFGQFCLSKEGTPTAVDLLADADPGEARVYPTVLAAGDVFTVLGRRDAPITILLSNAAGQLVLKREVSGGGQISTAGLSAGTYLFWLRSSDRMSRGLLLLR